MQQGYTLLIEILSHSHGQVRQYTLKALTKLTVPRKYYSLIKNLSQKDPAEYNRRAALQLLEYMEQEDGKEDAGKVGDRKAAAFKGSEDKLTAVNYKAEESRFQKC